MSQADEYMSPADFAAKVFNEGGTFAALEDGLKADELDPNDPESAALRAIWTKLRTRYFDDIKPLLDEADEILELLEAAG